MLASEGIARYGAKSAFAGEAIGEAGCCRVELVQWRNTQNLEHRSQHPAEAGIGVRHPVFARVRPGRQQHRAMRIHVIHAALCVVLGDEDGHASPRGRAGEILDDAAQRQIVICDVGRLRGITVGGTFFVGVIVRQVQEQQPREGTFAVAVHLPASRR